MSPSYTAPGFYDFVQDERKRIAQAFAEVEEIQKDYQGRYTTFRADHDKTLRELADQILAAPNSVDPTLCQAIDARLPVESKWTTDRIAELDRNVTDSMKQADSILARAQKEQTDLAEINPQLNQKEEALKADLATWQQKLDGLNGQVQNLAGGLGFVFRAGQISQLDRERYRALGRIEELSNALNKTRKEWQDLQASVVKEEGDWKGQWEQAVAAAGALRAERDNLAQDPDRAARRRATTYVLDNLKTPAAAATQPALDAALKHMVELNIQTDDYQSALYSVAGILGAAKGMDEGLRCLGESIKAVMDEQNQHDQYLAPVKIEVPDRAAAFGQTWDDLAAKARDEKAFAEHPKEFAAAMQPFVDSRLTSALIGDYFDTLGQALKSATAGWKG